MWRAHHLDRLADNVARILAPAPAPRPLSQFLSTIRITEGPQGPRPEEPRGDLFDWRKHRGQYATLRMFATRRYQTMVVLSIPQDGKDTGINVPIILYTAAELRRSVVYAVTDRNLSKKMYNAKIRPVIEASGLSWMLPTEGAGSATGTPDDILFATGARLYQLGAGASNGAGQAGVTAWLVIINEADKIRRPQREKLLDRNKSYQGDRVNLLIGTLDRDDDTGLQALYDLSSHGRLWFLFPCCAQWRTFEPDRERFVFDAASDDAAYRSARYRCPCGAEHDEDARRAIVEGYGELVMAGETIAGPRDAPVIGGTAIPTRVGGIRWWALESPRRDMREVAVLWRQKLEVKDKFGDHEPLREFYHTELCLPYRDEELSLQLREMELAKRSAAAPHKRGEAPAEADLCAVAIDMQLRRLYFAVIAYSSKDQRWWIIDYDRVAVCGELEQPTPAQRVAALDKIRARTMDGYPRPSGTLLRPMIGGVDTADGNTRPQAMPWLQASPGWYAIRGEHTSGTAHPDDAAGEAIFRLPGVLAIFRQKKAIPVWDQFAISDTLKGEVCRALMRASGQPGAADIPAGEAADGDLVMQLCSERYEKTDSGHRWVQRRRHNHYFDCAYTGLGLVRYLAHSLTTPRNGGGAVAAAAAVAGG